VCDESGFTSSATHNLGSQESGSGPRFTLYRATIRRRRTYQGTALNPVVSPTNGHPGRKQPSEKGVSKLPSRRSSAACG
jgi:hypothetical protein